MASKTFLWYLTFGQTLGSLERTVRAIFLIMEKFLVETILSAVDAGQINVNFDDNALEF